MEPGPEIPDLYQRNYSDLTVIEVDVRTCVPFMQIQHGEHSLIPDNVLFNIGKNFKFYILRKFGNYFLEFFFL